MSLWRLVIREILFRKLNFTLAVLSVLAAVGFLVAEMTLLRKHDLQTEEIVAQKESETASRMQEVEESNRLRMAAFEKETAARMKVLEDDYRKIMRNLGFNILILPRDQSVPSLFAEETPSHYMPEEYAERLAKSKVATINHLLPSLHQKTKWPEQENSTIILMGVRGEVPILHADPKKPLLQPVPPGTIVVGHWLHRGLKLQVGDKVRLMGRDFKVHQLQPERGNKDDITLWINLREAQELLDRKGQISAILALECNCEADRLDKVREEVAGILPDTQVIEFASQALTRSEARNRAAAEAVDARRRAETHAQRERERTAAWAAEVIGSEKANRTRLRQEQESFANMLIPLALAGCVVWVGVLAFNNVRERQVEIGILRAIGVGSTQVLALFLIKAVLVGCVGAVVGYMLGSLVGVFWGGSAVPARDLYSPTLLLLVLASAPVLCSAASWIPALLATKQDPAVVLREE